MMSRTNASTTTTTDSSSSDYEPSNTEGDTSSSENEYRKEKRLFWSDGLVAKNLELEIPRFNTVESGYLADDESDTEEKPIEKMEVKLKKRSNEMSKSSSLFLSDSDGFEERAVL
ncbi:hypothetical protein L5515_017036 [Caenorhabditis briggsae]|uniref:Uncharacterized protein n=3 Tax=Caenorhabditis briggsae TaxID=6238 RepID=A0AAE9JPJ2_CAEBR|nr:hypothetical protein L5515_017036 [Caenorhabditis briggsae]